MNEIHIETIKWSAPEYLHKEHSNDWFWTIGLLAILGCIAAIWFGNYIFAIFIFISGISLIMFTARPPKMFNFSIDAKGIKADRDEFVWKNLKGFNIKEVESGEFDKLLIETDKNFLPIYTFMVPKDIVESAKDEISKKINRIDIDESRTTQFAEKIGF